MAFTQRHAVLVILLTSLIPIITSGVGIIQGPDHPEGMSIPPPESHDRMSEAVLLIVLDGLPAYIMDDPDYMPHLANWAQYGSTAKVLTSEITLTGACTKEMSTGRHASPIDALRNWEVEYEGEDDAWHYAVDEGMSVAFTGFYVWSNLFPDERFIHETVYDSGFSDVYDADDQIIENVNKWIEDDKHDLMIAHLGGTDHAGHIHGVISDPYKDKMNHLDQQLNEIRKNIPENWTLMITADHGMSEMGGHAISTGDMAMEVDLLMSGSGIKNGTFAEMKQTDIASIPLVLLDLPFPVSADSRIPIDLFELSSQEKVDLERWNWQAQVERQMWLQQNGQPYADVSQELIEWEVIPTQTQNPGVLDVISSILPLLIIAFMAIKMSSGRKLKHDKMVTVLAITLGYSALIFSHYIWFYDLSQWDLSDKWMRKISGVVSVSFTALLITWYLFVTRRRKEPITWNIPWWTPYLAMAVVLLQPDSRLSPALVCFALILIPYSKTRKSEHSKLHTWTVLAIAFSSMWSMINYLPKIFTGESLQSLTGIEFLYKIWQQTVNLFMTDNIGWALGLVLSFSYLAHILSEREKRKDWILLATPLCFVVVIHWIGNSWTDRIIILCLVFCLWQMFENRRNTKRAIKSPFSAKWSELFMIGIIIPTWGGWPAMITLVMIRAMPRFIDDHLSWMLKPASNQLEESCRKIILAVIPWLLLAMVWNHFSLLTPMGLIEFNPSKLIVTGGFFGARTDPPILWMGLMIILPLMVSSTIIVNAWNKAGFDLTPALILTTFMFTTNVVNLWLSLLRPQVLLIVGFSTIVYLFWIICLALAQKSLTEHLNPNVRSDI